MPLGRARRGGLRLVARAGRYPNERGASLKLRVFAREPGCAEGVSWHGLEELYG